MIVFLAAPACGDDGAKERTLLELRPVLAENPPPCAERAPGENQIVRPLSAEGKITACLALGRPIVDARDVRSATVAATPVGAPALSVVLGSVGSANLDGFARRNQGRRLAILTEGEVVSAPVVNFTSFAGRVQVSGLSKEATDDLFRRLNNVIKAG